MCSRMATANIKEMSKKKCSLIFVFHSWIPSNCTHTTNFWIQQSEKPTDPIPVLHWQLSAYQAGNSWFGSNIQTHSNCIIVWSFGDCQVQYGNMLCGFWQFWVALPMSVIFCASGMCLTTASDAAAQAAGIIRDLRSWRFGWDPHPTERDTHPATHRQKPGIRFRHSFSMFQVFQAWLSFLAHISR